MTTYLFVFTGVSPQIISPSIYTWVDSKVYPRGRFWNLPLLPESPFVISNLLISANLVTPLNSLKFVEGVLIDYLGYLKQGLSYSFDFINLDLEYDPSFVL